MKHMLERLAGKPDEDDNSHAEAKMQVLHELRSMAMDMMGDKVKDRLPHEAPPKDGASDSGLPHHGSNGSPMDAAAEDVAEQTEHGRSEPAGDEGEPDQKMLNPHRNAMTEDGPPENEDQEDMYDDLEESEIDQHIEHLKKLKQSKMMKR